jgi:hypothetical protein
VKVRVSQMGGMVSSSASDGVDEGVCSGLRCTSDVDCASEAPPGEGRVESVEVMVFPEALSWSLVIMTLTVRSSKRRKASVDQ